MRHRQKGRHLGRTSSHRKAMLRNMACSLFLTERDPDFYDGMTQADGKTAVNPPRFKGRIVTTLHKAKEVRPLVEKCITIAKKGHEHQTAANEFASDADRNSEAWKKWRESDQWQKWNQAVAPAINARRRLFSMLRDKDAVEILLNDIAPRFATRPGGYTRVMQLAMPRLGDAGTQAILELVGVNDRVKMKSEKPAFADEPETDTPEPETEKPEAEPEVEEATAEADSGAEADAGDAAEEATEE